MAATTINHTTSIDRLYILSIFDDSGEFESPITVYSVKANNLKEAKDKFFKILKDFIEKLIKQHVYITEGDELEKKEFIPLFLGNGVLHFLDYNPYRTDILSYDDCDLLWEDLHDLIDKWLEKNKLSTVTTVSK